MSKRNVRKIRQHPNQPRGGKKIMEKQFQVDVSGLQPEACECGCRFFEPVVMVIKVPSVMSPTGKEETTKLPVLLCAACDQPFIENEQSRNIIEGNNADTPEVPGDGVADDVGAEVVETKDVLCKECGRKLVATLKYSSSMGDLLDGYFGECLCGAAFFEPLDS